MEFTYDAYESLIILLKNSCYEVANYYNWSAYDKCVILRHDIDYDIKKALELANLEENMGVRSTYFVLVTSDFYNIFSATNADMLNKISSLGHEIGLHFDEVRYPGLDLNGLKEKIILDSDVQIPNIVNSYSNTFFKSFKYLSDSRRRRK